MNIISKFCLLSGGVLLLSLSACKKSYLDRKPSDVVPIEDAFKTTTGCKAALEGIHSLMYRETDHDQFGQKSIDLINDLMGEDMPVSGQGAGWFMRYLTYSDPRSGAPYIWTYYYQFVNNCNQILEHIDAAEGPDAEKDNIKGQTYFYLAYAYYNLSLYYQYTYAFDKTLPGVPIYHEVTQEGNPRASMDEVYKEIVSDLQKAETLLDPANGAPIRDNKSQINIDVVRGLYARVALVMQNWPLAADMAEKARANYPYMTAKQLMSGFNDWGSSSWMWGSYINQEQTGIYASFLSQMDVALGGYAAYGQQKLINKALLNYTYHDSSNALGYDIRYDWWFMRSISPYEKFSQRKFSAKTPGSFSSDVCYMRSEEMGLIQAEALAHMGGANLAQAKDVLNELMVIRNPKYDADAVISARTYYAPVDSSGSPTGSLTDQDKLLLEIWQERRTELWGEGFRFSDLKRCAVFKAAGARTGWDERNLLYYQGLHRGASGGGRGIYGSADNFGPLDSRFLFRIPQSEMNYNPNMVNNP